MGKKKAIKAKEKEKEKEKVLIIEPKKARRQKSTGFNETNNQKQLISK